MKITDSTELSLGNSQDIPFQLLLQLATHSGLGIGTNPTRNLSLSQKFSGLWFGSQGLCDCSRTLSNIHVFNRGSCGWFMQQTQWRLSGLKCWQPLNRSVSLPTLLPSMGWGGGVKWTGLMAGSHFSPTVDGHRCPTLRLKQLQFQLILTEVCLKNKKDALTPPMMTAPSLKNPNF